MLVIASLVLGFATLDAFSGFVVVWLCLSPMRLCLDVIAMMPVALCIPFPFFAPCDDMLAMLVCANCWLPMYLYTLAYMSMHKSFLLVCYPYFNTMKLWTSDPNLHLSPVDTALCLLARLFAFLPVCLLSCLFALLLVCSHIFFYVCHIYHVYLLHASIMCSLYFFLSLLAC